MLKVDTHIEIFLTKELLWVRVVINFYELLTTTLRTHNSYIKCPVRMEYLRF